MQEDAAPIFTWARQGPDDVPLRLPVTRRVDRVGGEGGGIDQFQGFEALQVGEQPGGMEVE